MSFPPKRCPRTRWTPPRCWAPESSAVPRPAAGVRPCPAWSAAPPWPARGGPTPAPRARGADSSSSRRCLAQNSLSSRPRPRR